MTQRFRMMFTFLSSWKKKMNDILWYVKAVQNSNLSVHNWSLLAYSHAHSFHGCIYVTMAELSGGNRAYLVHKANLICCLGFYWNHLLTPVWNWKITCERMYFHQTQNQRLLSQKNASGERRAFPNSANKPKQIKKQLRRVVYANGCSQCVGKKMVE